MKNTIKILSILFVLLISVTCLASCSTYSSIKKNFESEGYTIVGEEPTGKIETEDGVITYKVHTFQKKSDDDNKTGLGDIWDSITTTLSSAIVWEFKSDKDLAKAMDESEEMKELLGKAHESQLVNGNCFLMTFNPEAIEIFNKNK